MSESVTDLLAKVGKQVNALSFTVQTLEGAAKSTPGLERAVRALLGREGLAVHAVPGIILKLSKNRSLGAALTGPDGEILLANQAFNQLTGSGAVSFFHDAAYTEPLEDSPWKAFGGSEFTSIRVATNAGAGPTWLQFVTRVLPDESGAGGGITFVTDVSEEVSAEQDILAALSSFQSELEGLSGPIDSFTSILQEAVSFKQFSAPPQVLSVDTNAAQTVQEYEFTYNENFAEESGTEALTSSPEKNEMPAPDLVSPAVHSLSVDGSFETEPALSEQESLGEPESISEMVSTQPLEVETETPVSDSASLAVSDSVEGGSIPEIAADLDFEPALWREFSDFPSQDSLLTLDGASDESAEITEKLAPQTNQAAIEEVVPAALEEPLQASLEGPEQATLEEPLQAPVEEHTEELAPESFAPSPVIEPDTVQEAVLEVEPRSVSEPVFAQLSESVAEPALEPASEPVRADLVLEAVLEPESIIEPEPAIESVSEFEPEQAVALELEQFAPPEAVVEPVLASQVEIEQAVQDSTGSLKPFSEIEDAQEEPEDHNLDDFAIEEIGEEGEIRVTVMETLPVEEAVDQVPAVTSPAHIAHQRRALVVDDIPVNQKLLRHLLRRQGFEVDIAANGQEAIALYRDGNYEVVFMDCDMPVMNGYDATAEIRRMEVDLGRHVPIVAMTSYDRDSDKERCLQAGMDDYLTKGVNEHTLARVIQSLAASTAASQGDQVIQSEIADTIGGGEIAPFDADAMIESYSRDELRDIMSSFLSAMEGFVGSMQRSIDQHDVETVTSLSNAIKGPCAALGLKLMTKVAIDLVNHAQANDWPQVRLKYLKLKTVYLRSQAELRRACPEVFEEAHNLIG